MMTQAKRIDGVESGIERLASLLEDLARSSKSKTHHHHHHESTDKRKSKSKEDVIPAGVDIAGSSEKKSETGLTDSKTDQKKRPSLKSLNSLYELEERVAALEARLGMNKGTDKGDKSGTSIEVTGADKGSDAEGVRSTEGVPSKEGGDDDVLLKLRQKVKELGDKIGGLSEITKHIPPQEIIALLMELKRKKRTQSKDNISIDPTDSDKIDDISSQTMQETRLTDLEMRLEERSKDMYNLNTTINNQLSLLQSQFTDLERDLANLLERVNTVMPGGEGTDKERGINDLYSKLQEQQADIEMLAEHAQRLAEEKEERQQHIDALIEQMEVLKTIKADKEDLEDALADKADACAINRKVSHDQFDAACDDLSRSIEEALAKLTQQETLWQAALDDIQREIGNKLDKMELSPLRDFINHKLKNLQDRLKALAALKRETEAAGSKSKFLRNVNCISCDKDVVMRKEMDTCLYPPAPALPSSKNIGPYLAYELDALRKQQKG